MKYRIYYTAIALLFFLLYTQIMHSQTAPGGIGNADGSDGEPELLFWLDADSTSYSDGDHVNSWTDISDNGRDFSQSAAGEQATFTASAINNRPAIDFGGDTDVSLVDDDAENYINGQNAFTVFTLIKSDVTGTNAGFFDGEDPDVNDDVFMARYDSDGYNGGGNNVIKFGISTTNDGEVNMESSENLQTTNAQLLAFQWESGSELELYADGAFDSPTSPSGIADGSLTNAKKLILGKGAKDAGSSWRGKVAEVFLYANKLNSARRTIVENYLSVKYGITISNDKFTNNDGAYIHDLTGIGKKTDGEHASANSAGVYITQSGNFDAGDYLLAAHDNTTNDAVSIRTGAEITNSGAEAAWNRDWYIEKTGNLDAQLSFNIPEAVAGGKYPETASNYVLLYRSGTTGDYSQLDTASSIDGSDEVVFNVSDSELQNGYYTLGSIDQSASPVEGKNARTWYTLVSGDWNNSDIWTLDPSGALPDNPNNETPDASNTDNVVILTGRTVTVQADGKTNGRVKVGGRLDLQGTSGHNFSEIRGDGRILLSSKNFPSGDSTHFVTPGQGEGTVEFYGKDYSLPTDQAFYNMEVNLAGKTDSIILLSDYTINGNLKITQGDFRINNNSSTTRLTLDVAGDVTVGSDASITTGTGDAYSNESAYGDYHKSFHVFRVGGDFTNNGIVRMTNLSVPDYANPADNGAVSLVMYGESDTRLACDSTTDLYNLVVDKGSDRSYEVELYAGDKSYFALFGQNDDDWNDSDAAHPENRKALWIRNGTLRLTGNVFIPSLTEGGRDYTIGERAALVLDGSNVTVHNTADDDYPPDDYSGFSHGIPNGIDNDGTQQALYPFGKLQVDNGYFLLGEGQAINFRDEAPGIIEVNGGTLEANQIAISSLSNSEGFAYTQTGGSVHLNKKYNSDGNNAMLNLDKADMNFTMSGGDLYVTNTTGHDPNAVHIASTEGNYNISGGTLHLDAGSNNMQVSSSSPFYNVNITPNPNDNNATTVTLQDSLTVLNDLTVQSTETLDASGNAVSVARNFDLKDGGIYTHGDNTTYLIGDKSSDIFVRNTTIAGELPFNNLTIKKDQRVAPGAYFDVHVKSGSGRATTDHPVEIQGNLTIERGEFDVNTWEVDLKGDMEIVDGHVLYDASTPGFIVMNNGSAAQTIEGPISGSYNFGNMEFSNSNGITLLSDVDVDDVRLNSGVINMDLYNLDISGNLTSSGTYGSSLMFAGAGNASDGGLTLPVDLADGSVGAETLFPIGTGSSYNFAKIFQENTVADSGKVTITPVNNIHPSTKDASKTIAYYWVMDTTGFSTLDSLDLRYTFKFSGSFPGGVKRGVNLWPENYTWIDNGNVENAPYLEFPASAPLRSDFTLGNSGNFKKPEVYYSITPSADYDFGNMPAWSDGGNWSNDSHTGASAGDFPDDGDVAIIGYGGTDPVDGGGPQHHIAYQTNGLDLAKVKINSSEDPNVRESRLFIGTAATIDMGILEGDGTLEPYLDPANPIDIQGDLGNFTGNAEEGARVLFFGENVSGDTVEIPDNFKQLPNVKISSGAPSKVYHFPRELQVLGDMEVDSNATFRVEHDLTVEGDLQLGRYKDGSFEFPNDKAYTVTVKNDFIIDNGNSEVTIDNSATNGLEHRLRLSGDIRLKEGQRFDLFSDNTGGNNAILEFFGDTSRVWTNSAGMPVDLYRMEMNKLEGKNMDVQTAFNLNGPTDGAEKALSLISGNFRSFNASTTIPLTTGGADFKIPQGTQLMVKNGTVTVSGNNTGIWLDDTLTAGNASTWNLNGGTNNYIEYSASGNAVIDINQAEFYVGSQIRRNTVTDGGILSFNQNHGNSTVVIGTNANAGGATNRGVFELVKAGSYFSQAENATLTIANHVTGASAPALDIQLADSEFSLSDGSTIAFGSSTTTTDQDFSVSSNQPLKNLKVDKTSSNNPKVTMETSLSADTLTIDANTEWDANGLDLTLNGDFIANGTFTSTKNTVYFSGSADQQIYGSPAFYNLTKNTTNTLTLNADITANNELRLESGTFADGGNTLTAKGHVWMDATHNHTAGGEGVRFYGNDRQELRGSGTFGKLTVENYNDIYLPEGNTITISDELKMITGVLDIGKNLLVLGENASIQEANPFGPNNMVQTNISFTDNGIKRYYKGISSTQTFIYPLGSSGKYTPVEVNIDQKDAGGSIRVKAADEMHPGIIDDNEAPDTEITDADNVLQYHWVLDAESITGFSGDMEMEYAEADVTYTNPYNETDYITARLLGDSTNWNKYDQSSFDISNNRLNFTFSGVDAAGISGDYIAGVDGSDFNGAIPDEVPIYHSAQDGDWFADSTWEEDISGGPKGAIAIVETGDSVYFSSNYLVGYKTIVEENAVLDAGTTFGHRVGTMEGKGKLRLERGALPAGVYDDFFGPNGGIIEFSGSDSYDVLSEITYVNNLHFSGTGDRRLPNLDFETYGNFKIKGDNDNLKVINEHDRTIKIDSNLVRTAGSFDAGTGASRLVFQGDQLQEVTGAFTNTNAWHNFTINSTANLVLNDTVEVEGDAIDFIDGNVITTSTNILRLDNNATGVVNTYNDTSFVDGPLQKRIGDGQDFIFPVGDGDRLGKFIASSANTSGSKQFWEAEYYNRDPSVDNYDPTSFADPLKYVSKNEYWRLSGPTGTPTGDDKASATIRWDEQSGVSGNYTELRIAQWKSTQWEAVGDDVTGDTPDYGTIKTTNDITHLGDGIFTIATTYLSKKVWVGGVNGDETTWAKTNNWEPTGIPDFATTVTIPDTASYDVTIAGNAKTDTTTIKSSRTVTVNPGGSLEINGDLFHAGILKLASDASGTGYLQTNGTITDNGGDITIEQFLSGGEYHYITPSLTGIDTAKYTETSWGDINPNFYTFDEAISSSDWLDGWKRLGQSSHGGTLNVGLGYIVYRNQDITYTMTKSIGNLNNGEIREPVDSTDKNVSANGWNIIGNPYTSPVNADLFIDENAVNNTRITGSLYFWDDDGSEGGDYTSDDYATYNDAGGVAGGGGTEPNGFVDIGQSFMVKARNSNPTDVRFTETMRSTQSAVFFKSATKGNTDSQKGVIQKIRLRLKNSRDQFNETLLAFTEGATEDYDVAMDGEKLKGNPDIAFYSMLGDKEYAIQAYPALSSYDGNDVRIPLGYDSGIKGSHTIWLESLKNISDSTTIYLHDMKEGTFHDMQNREYEFKSEDGMYHDRFEILVDPGFDKNINDRLRNDNVKIYSWKNTAHIVRAEHGGNAVIYDMQGRQVKEVRRLYAGENTVRIPNPGIYVVKVNTKKGMATKKVWITE